MSPKKLIGVALLVAGVILLVLGYQSSQGLDDQISEALTGEFTDRTLWYWITGGMSSAIGLVLLGGK
jgi:drug/metabolite transporter (DMT)-like permease